MLATRKSEEFVCSFTPNEICPLYTVSNHLFGKINQFQGYTSEKKRTRSVCFIFLGYGRKFTRYNDTNYCNIQNIIVHKPQNKSL